MSRFLACLKIVLEHEGGYVDHPLDKGGATNKGITQKVYSDWLKLRGLPDQSVRYIHADEVELIYLGAYWRKVKGDSLPEPIDLLVFDFAVNSGPNRAMRYLQRALGVAEDGIYGPETASAIAEEIRTGGITMLCHEYLDLRRGYIDRIIANNPSQAVFAKGWTNRVDGLDNYVV